MITEQRAFLIYQRASDTLRLSPLLEIQLNLMVDDRNTLTGSTLLQVLFGSGYGLFCCHTSIGRVK